MLKKTTIKSNVCEDTLARAINENAQGAETHKLDVSSSS